MQFLLKSVLAGTAALGLIAAGAPARAHPEQVPVVRVLLPDGEVASVALVGDPAATLVPVAVLPAPPGPLAVLEQVSATMQRQADSMLREVGAISSLDRVDPGRLPPGVQVYEVQSIITGNGACTRRTEIAFTSGAASPQRISSQSGACGETVHPDRPRLIEARSRPAPMQVASLAR